MEEFDFARETTYRYPPLYRMVALLGAVLFGFILLGSVIAEVEAIKNSRADAIVHLIGFIVGAMMLGLGIDFATRSITVTPDGLRVRGWLRRSTVPWPDVLGWRYLPLSLIHLRFRRGAGVYVWPLLEDYSQLLNEIDAHCGDKVTR
jgi:hypothetical protein